MKVSFSETQLTRRHQKGEINLGVIVGIIVLVVAAAVAYVILSAPEQPGVDERLLPLNEADTQTAETWQGVLRCDELPDQAAFERTVELLVTDDEVLYAKGDTEAFLKATDGGTSVPAELKARFEWWRGKILFSSVDLKGWYTEGPDRIKEVAMKGAIDNDIIHLEGKRGPRNCTLEASKN